MEDFTYAKAKKCSGNVAGLLRYVSAVRRTGLPPPPLSFPACLRRAMSFRTVSARDDVLKLTSRLCLVDKSRRSAQSDSLRGWE